MKFLFKYFIFSLIIFYWSFIFSPSSVFAGIAVLSWNSNNESDLAGYKIYYGTSKRIGVSPPGGYANVVDVAKTVTPNTPAHIILSLTNGLTYFFSIIAYDTSGNQSGFSGEVLKVMPPISNPLGNVDIVSVGSVNRVDGFDLIKLLSKFGRSATVIDCLPLVINCYDTDSEIVDFNSDGKVNGFDLVILSVNFGKAG
ncbi:MAG: hypothetical protein AAB772_02320 [Patescibacteria group bacterium]